jgi:hypothetical protein
MLNEYIYFSIGFEDVDWGNKEDQARRNAFVKTFTEPIHIKCGFAGNGRIAFDHPKFVQFLEVLKQYAEQKKMVFKKNCAYAQEYTNEPEWYKYNPSKSIEGTTFDGNLITCNAANILPNVNIGCDYRARPIVSEKFKRIVEENSLTGLEFLWCKDVGRFAPPQQWYSAIATSFMGRGIDAPWINPELVNSLKSNKYPPFNLGRMAVTNFLASCLKEDADLPPRLKKYLSLCDANSFNIYYHERFLREYLPKTDFAFGYFPGWQGFYISKKAKEILLSNQLLNAHDSIEPIAVLEELPPGAILLDGMESVPDPYCFLKNAFGDMTILELKALHEQEKNNYQKILKPEKKLTIKQALNLVNSEKRKRPRDFSKRLHDKELIGSITKLPANWIELLKKTNGGYLSIKCELVPFKEIENFTADKLEQGKGFYEKYPLNRISIATKGDGDWYDLVLIDDFSKDCPVVQVTHEGGEVLHEWTNIASFVYDMILENEE